MTRHAKRDFMGIAKSMDPAQPAQSTHADHGRNFSLLADFLCINPLPDDKFQTLPNIKSLQTTISNLMKTAESYPNK